MTTKKSNPRHLTLKVKTAKGRKISSTSWLNRQLNDPYVVKAKSEGYLSRAAFKLIEINEKFALIKSSTIAIDIGAAPGGWTQVLSKKIKKFKGGKIIAIDITPMEPIDEAVIIEGDFLEEETQKLINDSLENNKADLILSDMAAPACGHAATDHLKIIALCEAALEFTISNLKSNGNFVAKILKGGGENELTKTLKTHFRQVKYFKPPSSRAESAESYIVAMGFREQLT